MSEALEAARQYCSTGRIAADLLRDPVYRAWVRSHTQGASALAAKAETLSNTDTERLLARQSALIRAATPFIHALSMGAAGMRHAAMLGDANAVVLDVTGDPETIHGPQPFPGPGAMLSEALSGANGIGSPLAEGDYIELVGHEHFIQGFHPFTCQGIPIRLANGQVEGVISTSLRSAEASHRLRDILVCAAHGIAAELEFQRLDAQLRATQPAWGGNAPLQLRQDLLQLPSIARLNVAAAARWTSQELLDRARQHLAAAMDSIARFRRQAALWRDLVEPAIGESGALNLQAAVADLTDLLATEARIRRVSLHTAIPSMATVRVDRHALQMTLLRTILNGFEQAGAGGSICLVLQELDASSVQISVQVHPALGHAQAAPDPVHFTIHRGQAS